MATDFLEFVSIGGSDGKGVRERHMDARGGALTKETGTTNCDARMADDNGGPCLLYDYIALPQKLYD
jgi:hypothetical protein